MYIVAHISYVIALKSFEGLCNRVSITYRFRKKGKLISTYRHILVSVRIWFLRLLVEIFFAPNRVRRCWEKNLVQGNPVLKTISNAKVIYFETRESTYAGKYIQRACFGACVRYTYIVARALAKSSRQALMIVFFRLKFKVTNFPRAFVIQIFPARPTIRDWPNLSV